MQRIIAQYNAKVFSDVERDGLGIELCDDQSNNVVAEVFRCDKNHTIVLNTFNNDLPLGVIELLIEFAKGYLEQFEDGTPLLKSRNL
jgi:hypothetical protein